jgi:hypothetical protein
MSRNKNGKIKCKNSKTTNEPVILLKTNKSDVWAKFYPVRLLKISWLASAIPLGD